MPCNASSCIWIYFSRCPFLTPFDHLSKGKRGACKNLATKQRNKNKGYNANNTSTHLPPLELMPHNAFLMYLEHFFKVPFSDPLWSPKQRKTGTCKNLQQNKETKTKGYNANITSTFTTFRAHALQCLLHVFGAFAQGALFWPPLITKAEEKGAPAKTCDKTKKQKQRLQCKQHLNTFTTFRAHASQCLLDVFGTFFQGALFWPLSSPQERKQEHLSKMNQNEEMFLESNVVSIFALSLKRLGGAQFWFLFSKIWKHVYSSTLGHQNITFF